MGLQIKQFIVFQGSAVDTGRRPKHGQEVNTCGKSTRLTELRQSVLIDVAHRIMCLLYGVYYPATEMATNEKKWTKSVHSSGAQSFAGWMFLRKMSTAAISTCFFRILSSFG